MSSTKESTEDAVDTEDVGGLGEILPAPLQPLWVPIARFQTFRQNYSDIYISIFEGILAIILIVGYLWWFYLFFVV